MQRTWCASVLKSYLEDGILDLEDAELDGPTNLEDAELLDLEDAERMPSWFVHATNLQRMLSSGRATNRDDHAIHGDSASLANRQL